MDRQDGQPAMNSTGMSRPIAPDGTIRYSTPAALAMFTVNVHSPANQHHHHDRSPQRRH